MTTFLTILKLRIRQWLNLFDFSVQPKKSRIFLKLVGILAALAIAAVVAAILVQYYPGVSRYPGFWQLIVFFGGAATILAVFVALFFGSDPLDPRPFFANRIHWAKLWSFNFLASFVGLGVLLFALVAIIITSAQLAGAGTQVGSSGIASNLAELSEASNPGLIAFIAVLLIIIQLVLHLRIGQALNRVIGLDQPKFRVLRKVLILVLAVSTVIVLWQLFSGVKVLEPAAWLSSNPKLEALSQQPVFASWALLGYELAGNSALVQALIWQGFGYLLVLILLWAGLEFLAQWLWTRPTAESAKKLKLGWFGLLNGSSNRAISAKSLHYWFSDPRYWVQFLVVPLAPLLVVVPLLIVDFPQQFLYLIPVPLMTLIIAWFWHNDLSFDGRAFWTQVSAGVDGPKELFGRTAPVLAFMLPVIILGSYLTGVLAGKATLSFAVLGIALAALGAGLGISSVSAIRSPYLVTRVHSNPLAQPIDYGARQFSIQLFTLLATILAAAVPAALACYGLIAKNDFWFFASFVVGAIIAVLVYRISLIRVGRNYHARAVQLLGYLAKS